MNELFERISKLPAAKRELLLRKLGRAGMQKAAAALLRQGAMSVDEMNAEAVLDDRIAPATPRGDRAMQPQTILLTGATGYLGAFLLYEILRQSDSHVVCLVRAQDEQAAVARVRQTMASYLLWDDRFAPRVSSVVGDLGQPNLSLSTHAFQHLAQTVGAIYHCGAAVKWTYPYRALKPVNVTGTHEVLRLACANRLKPVHFISTVGVFSSPDFPGDTVTEDEPLENSGSLFVGYAQSKWVAERLVEKARARGVPVTIHRPATGGHSETGVFNAADHVCLIIKGCVQLRCAADLDMQLQIAAVDYVSRAIVHLSRQPEAIGKVFHLAGPDVVPWRLVFEWVREAGYPLRRVSYARWLEMLRQAGRDENALYRLSPLFTDSILANVRLPRFDDRLTRSRLAASGIVCPRLDDELIQTYLRGFVRAGFLKPPSGAA